MVRIHPDPPLRESARVQGRAVRWKGGPDGAVAQLGERLLCKQEVVGSIPSGSTKASPVDCGCEAAFDPGSSVRGSSVESCIVL